MKKTNRRKVTPVTLNTNTNTGFLLRQLIHRDFTKRYKRTVLGFAWSILSPLLLYTVMYFAFSNLTAHRTPHYPVYFFAGYMQFMYMSSCTNGLMRCLVTNGGIFSKVNVEKILFIISENVTYLVTFFCMLVIYFIMVAIEPLPFTLTFLWLLVPIAYLILFVFSYSVIVAVLYVYIRDIRYLHPVIMRMALYLSGIFFNPASFPQFFQDLLWFNPLYLSVYFMRSIVIDNTVPSLRVFGLMAMMLVIFVGAATLLYQKSKKTLYLYL